MRIGVIGLGSMGRNHVRVLREIEAVDEVIGVDPSPAARASVYRSYRVAAVPDVDELLGYALDAVAIVTPPRLHARLAERCADAGLALLVEKPLGTSLEDCDRLVEVSERVPLNVGHVERFNPAVVGLRERLHLVGDLISISTTRIGPYPGRDRGVGVGLDLLTHDVDAIRHLSGSEFEYLSAVGGSFLSGHEDLIHMHGRLASGVVVSAQVGWLSPYKDRTIRAVGSKGTLVADTVLQEVTFHESAVEDEQFWEALAAVRGIGAGNSTRFALQRFEPLREEWLQFLAAVQKGDSPPVTAHDGRAAVEVVLRVQAQLKERP